MSVQARTLGELIAEAAGVAAAESLTSLSDVFAMDPVEVARAAAVGPVDDLVMLAASLEGAPGWRFVDWYAAGLVLADTAS